MNVIKPLFLLSLLTILQNIAAQELTSIDHPDKNEYILQLPGTDKHKYGYELKENKHFHHTTTEEDGVRLGCYGYALNGKKYSTQYVADIKGYRPVYTYDVIKVYPKSGGTREASFIRNFNEDERKSENIRYFFPEGCRGDDHMVLIPPEVNKMPPPVPFSPPPTRPPKPPVERISKTSSVATPPVIITRPPPVYTPPTSPPQKYLPPAPTYLPPKGKYITKVATIANPPITRPPPPPPTTPRPTPTTPRPTQPPTRPTQPPTRPTPPPYRPTQPPPQPKYIPPKTPIITEVPKNTCNAKSCCNDDALPKLVIPITLDAGRSGSCGRIAKLIVPADSVGMESLKTLLSNPSELAKTIIKSLT